MKCPQCHSDDAAGSDGHCRNCGLDLKNLPTAGVPVERDPLERDPIERDTIPDLDPDATDLPPPVPEEPAAGVALRLELQDARIFAGKRGSVSLRVGNLGESPMRRVTVALESELFSAVGRLVIEWNNLAVAQATPPDHRDFNVPATGGSYSVRISGNYFDSEETPYAFSGSFQIMVRDRDIVAMESSDRGASLVIEDGGAASLDEADLDGFSSIIVRGGGAADLGKLKKRAEGRPTGPVWIEIPVLEDFEQTRMLREYKIAGSQTPSILKGRNDATGPGRRAFLSYPGPDGLVRVQVWTGSECRLGRNPDSCDIISLLLPHNEHEKINQRVSQVHCLLRMEHNRVMLEDCRSTNGTFLDGRPVKDPVTLENGQVINLGKVLDLRCHGFRGLGETAEVHKQLNNCRTIMECATEMASIDMERTRREAPLDAFLLRRVKNFAGQLEYLILRRKATIGSSKYAAILIDHPSVAPHHARLLYVDGRYYLEDLKSKEGTSINGKRLPYHSPTLLPPDSHLALGGVTINFRIS